MKKSILTILISIVVGLGLCTLPAMAISVSNFGSSPTFNQAPQSPTGNFGQFDPDLSNQILNNGRGKPCSSGDSGTSSGTPSSDSGSTIPPVTDFFSNLRTEAEKIAQDVFSEQERRDLYLNMIDNLINEDTNQTWRDSVINLTSDELSDYLRNLATITDNFLNLNEDPENLDYLGQLKTDVDDISQNYQDEALLANPIQELAGLSNPLNSSQLRFLGYVEEELDVDIADLDVLEEDGKTIIFFDVDEIDSSGSHYWKYVSTYEGSTDSVLDLTKSQQAENERVLYHYDNGDKFYTIVAEKNKGEDKFTVGVWWWSRSDWFTLGGVLSRSEQIPFDDASAVYEITNGDDSSLVKFSSQIGRILEPNTYYARTFQGNFSISSFISYITGENEREVIANYKVNTETNTVEISDRETGMFGIYQGEFELTAEGLFKDGKAITEDDIDQLYTITRYTHTQGISAGYTDDHLTLEVDGQKIDIYGDILGYMLPSEIDRLKEDLAKLTPELRGQISRLFILTAKHIEEREPQCNHNCGGFTFGESGEIYLKSGNAGLRFLAHEATHQLHNDLDDMYSGKFSQALEWLFSLDTASQVCTSFELILEALSDCDEVTGYCYTWLDGLSYPDNGSFSAYGANNVREYLAEAVAAAYRDPEAASEVLDPNNPIHGDSYDSRYLETLMLAHHYGFISDELYSQIVQDIQTNHSDIYSNAEEFVNGLIDYIEGRSDTLPGFIPGS